MHSKAIIVSMLLALVATSSALPIPGDKGQKCVSRGFLGICTYWQDKTGPSEEQVPTFKDGKFGSRPIHTTWINTHPEDYDKRWLHSEGRCDADMCDGELEEEQEQPEEEIEICGQMGEDSTDSYCV